MPGRIPTADAAMTIEMPRTTPGTASGSAIRFSTTVERRVCQLANTKAKAVPTMTPPAVAITASSMLRPNAPRSAVLAGRPAYHLKVKPLSGSTWMLESLKEKIVMTTSGA